MTLTGTAATAARALLAAMMAAGAVLAGPALGVAHAAPASSTCEGTSIISYQPGLTETPRPVHYAEKDLFSACLSTDSTLTHGITTATADVTGSCTNLPIVLRDPGYTIIWNNGQNSVIDLVYTDTIVLGTEQVTGTGTVTSGEFAGGNATIVWTYPVLTPAQCLTPGGVTAQTGNLTAQITQT